MEQPRFIVDVNVGRVAKWLRVLGYDALFPSEHGDNELVRVALRENRIIVTKDSRSRRKTGGDHGTPKGRADPA